MDYISRKLAQNAGSRGPIVLMYHSISNDLDNWKWSLSLVEFERQMDYLKDAGWNTIRLSDITKYKESDSKVIAITFDDGYKNNYEAYLILKKMEMCATWFVVSEDIGENARWEDEGMPSDLNLLDENSLKEMHDSGMEIGSHSKTHRNLLKLTLDNVRVEVQDSKHKIEKIIGEDVVSFAYPYGKFSQEVASVVQEFGFRFACSTQSGYGLTGGDLYSIKRLTIYSSDTVGSLARKLAFADNDAGWKRTFVYLGNQLFHKIKKLK